MTTVIDAIIFRGSEVSTKNMGYQLPELVRQFPNIKNVHPGSIKTEQAAVWAEVRIHHLPDPLVGCRSGPMADRDI